MQFYVQILTEIRTHVINILIYLSLFKFIRSSKNICHKSSEVYEKNCKFILLDEKLQIYFADNIKIMSNKLSTKFLFLGVIKKRSP